MPWTVHVPLSGPTKHHNTTFRCPSCCSSLTVNILTTTAFMVLQFVAVFTLISSTLLHLTGSVKSSSAFSNQLLKAEAFFANVKYRSSTWRYCSWRRNRRCLRASESPSRRCHLVVAGTKLRYHGYIVASGFHSQDNRVGPPGPCVLSLPGNHITVAFLNGWCLGMVINHQFLFQGSDGLYAFFLKGLQSSIKRLLFCQQGLDRW